MTDFNFPEQLSQIFGALTSGYHITIDDGGLYHDLKSNEEYYRQLFSLLGYRLCDGQHDIFYFLPDEGKINDLSKKYTAFMSVMFDWIADEGKEPVGTLFREPFFISQLPHIQNEKWAKALSQMQVTSAGDLIKIAQGLQRHGFIELIDNEQIHFRKASMRFVELFKEIAERLNSPEETTYD